MATLTQIHAAMTGFPYNLSWNDFQTRPASQGAQLSAFVSTSYRTTNWNVALLNGAYRPRGFRVTVVVNRTQSWALSTAKQSNTLLPHEQGHLDITGLIARDLTGKVLDLSIDASVVQTLKEAGNTAQSRLNYVARRFQQSFAQFNQRAQTLMSRLQSNGGVDGIYDQQTNHGQNTTAQTRWNNLFHRVKSGGDDFDFSLALSGINL
jgi:hypothetical protein